MDSSNALTLPALQAMKREGRKIVGVVAWDFQMAQIADRAGLSRTVVYRHFADRADLDAAVQARALELLRAELVPALGFEGTPVEIIRASPAGT